MSSASHQTCNFISMQCLRAILPYHLWDFKLVSYIFRYFAYARKLCEPVWPEAWGWVRWSFKYNCINRYRFYGSIVKFYWFRAILLDLQMHTSIQITLNYSWHFIQWLIDIIVCNLWGLNYIEIHNNKSLFTENDHFE